MLMRKAPKGTLTQDKDYWRRVLEAKQLLRASWDYMEVKRIYKDDTVPAMDAEDNTLDFIRCNILELGKYKDIEILQALAEDCA